MIQKNLLSMLLSFSKIGSKQILLKAKTHIKEWRTLQDEMRELGVTENQIFQMQMIEVEQPKKITGVDFDSFVRN